MLIRNLPVVGIRIGARGDVAGDQCSRRGRRRSVAAKLLRRVFADLTITATSVTTSATPKVKNAGETITAGQAVYVKASDGKLYKAQADGTAEEATAAGIALNGGAVDQPIAYQDTGDITIGATVAVGTLYVVSATAGGIAPWADLSSTNRVTLLGIGKTTGVITLDINAYGIQKA